MARARTQAPRFYRGVERPSSGRRRISIGRGVAWVILILVLFITVFPFFWALRTAFSDNAALFSSGQTLLPVQPTTINIERVLGLVPLRSGGATFDYLTVLRTTVIVATVITIGQVSFSALAAYAFARLHWPGRDLVFYIFLAGLMIPGIVTLIPNFMLIRDIGWLNTIPGVIAPYFLMTPFAVFFLRQFFLGISRSLEEAAMIDGASHARIFRSVIVPVSTAPLFTIAILTYITAWNEYLWPLLVGRTDEARVLTVALGIFTTQQPGRGPDWAGLMAATLLAALPILLLFVVFSRRVVDSIQFTGLK